MSYFKFHLSTVVKPILTIGISVILFQSLLLFAYEAVEGSEFIDFFLKEIENHFNTSLEAPRFLLTSPLSYISLGWRHPLVIILVASFVFSRASSAVALEREGGYGDLLFTRPIERWKILWQHFAVTLVALLVISLLKILATSSILSLQTIPSPDLSLLFWMGLMSFSLYALMASYSYLFSVLSSAKGQAMGLATGLTLFFFALEIVGDLWDRAAPIQLLSIFYYYQPFSILLGQEDLFKNIAALLAPALLIMALSFYLIERRDL